MSSFHLFHGNAVRFRQAAIVVAGIGFGLYMLRHAWKKYKSRMEKLKVENEAEDEAANGFLPLLRSAEGSNRSVRLKRQRTPSSIDRLSFTGTSGSLSSQKSVRLNRPPSESELLSSLERFQDLVQSMKRASSALELIRNRSEKDKQRSEQLNSIFERMVALEEELNHVVQEGINDKDGIVGVGDEGSCYATASYKGGTLSVLSDDSFVSAFEDFPVSFDDVDVLMREPLNLEKSSLLFYQDGMSRAIANGVSVRKSRTEFCSCENDIDFMSKVWCLRQAFSNVLNDERNRVWLSQSCRHLIADLMRHARKEPKQFYLAYDAMINFLSEECNASRIQEELKRRGVVQFGFWDVVLDFILIDCFEDLSRPPSVVLAVARNMFLNHSMKESTLTTVIWSMLKAKRARLLVKDGFISRFYDISEVISPIITLGFFGTDDHMRELCLYFKEQVCSFVNDIFNISRVRYTSLDELSEDVWLILRTRTEMLQTRLSTELLPSA